MVSKQQKNVDKAKFIVEKSLSTFTKAIEEVNKANNLLQDAVDSDEKRLEEITKEINRKYKELDVVQSEKIDKIAEIRSNKDLIAKLEQFTK